MELIATLVAASSMNDEDVQGIIRAIGSDGIAETRFEWIDEGVAGDLHATMAESIETRESGNGAWLRSVLDAAIVDSGREIDVIVQRADQRAKRLLIADMDSTMITVECIDELADFAGIKPQIAAITERAMRGDIDFHTALDERVALLKGLPEGVIDECLAMRVRAAPGARVLVRTLAAHGCRSVLVSGGFTRFAEPVAAMIGFDRAVANVLEIDKGVLTGKVVSPVVDAATKLATLEAECTALGIDHGAVLAIGDGANDIPMLEAAGLGIAYHAHPRAAGAADAAIRYGDHRVTLYGLGIPSAEWVND